MNENPHTCMKPDGKPGKPKTFRITSAHDCSTPESAREGDFSESEMDDAEGIVFQYTEEGIEDAANYLNAEGVIEFDSWFSTGWYGSDYCTGEERNDHFFVHVDVKPEEPWKSRIEEAICEKMNIC